MYQETIEVNGKRLSVSIHRQTFDLSIHDMCMIFYKIRDCVKNSLIVEDPENPGRYELNDEATRRLRFMANLMIEFYDERTENEWFWESFTVMIVAEEEN